jgi:hypothetical protein
MIEKDNLNTRVSFGIPHPLAPLWSLGGAWNGASFRLMPKFLTRRE